LNALPPLGDSRARASLHAAVAAVFFALGVGIGLWGGASGVILIRAGVDAATFGVLLTVYTAAYLIAMSASGALAHRFGVEQALPVSAIIYGATLCALLNASSETWVAVALIIAGLLGGVVDVLMNAKATIAANSRKPAVSRGMAVLADPQRTRFARPSASAVSCERRISNADLSFTQMMWVFSTDRCR
jgi:MFS family permease